MDQVEDGGPQDEEARIDPDFLFRHGRDPVDRGRVRPEVDGVDGLGWPHREQGGDGIGAVSFVDQLWQRDVGQAVRVVGEEQILGADEASHRPKPLSDRHAQAAVDDRDRPPGSLAVEQMLSRHTGQGRRLVEVFDAEVPDPVPDTFAPEAHTEDEVGVSVGRIPFHEMPENGLSADQVQRFRRIRGAFRGGFLARVRVQ